MMQALVSLKTYPNGAAGATHRTTRPFRMGACAQLRVVHRDVPASLSPSGGKNEARKVLGVIVATEEWMSWHTGHDHTILGVMKGPVDAGERIT